MQSRRAHLERVGNAHRSGGRCIAQGTMPVGAQLPARGLALQDLRPAAGALSGQGYEGFQQQRARAITHRRRSERSSSAYYPQ